MEHKLFFVDKRENIYKSYEDLYSDIKHSCSYNKYCIERSYYEIFKQIVLSLILDKEIILLDSDFSIAEVERLIEDKSLIERSEEKIDLSNYSFDLDRILQGTQIHNWRITLFTSGTTGLPKRISHTFTSITREVKKSANHANDIWGFAYNPTHMAGLQVFFQALLNFNTIVRIFSYLREEIYTLIEEYGITNISATPTFYRLLLPVEKSYGSVVRLTSGGEKFDSKTQSNLLTAFPNAKLTNVYASTEAGTLFAAKGDVFQIKQGMENLFKIVGDELYIHRDLVGSSDSIKLQGDWYPTGDLISVVSESPFTFKFISRKNEMINVGGYKVNPHEVEEVIRSYPGVSDVVVYSKRNSVLGNIICCNIVSLTASLKEKDIRLYLSQRLQEFKIPRIIKFVDKLDMTRTGKITRDRL